MTKAIIRSRWLLALGALVLFLVGSGCGDSEETTASRSYGMAVESTSTAVALCDDVGGSTEPCRPRNVSSFHLFSDPTGGGIGFIHGPEATVEEALEKGLDLAEASPVHLAVRGTADIGSVRCDWRGIAMAPYQREEVIRFLLGLEASDDIPEASYLEILFDATLDALEADFRETAKSNFFAIARGGVSNEYLFLACYVDYTVNEYFLGGGPTTLTVAYDRRGEARSYDLYRKEHDAGQFGDDLLMSKGRSPQCTRVLAVGGYTSTCGRPRL